MKDQSRDNAIVAAATAASAALSQMDPSALATVILATVPSLVALAAPIFLGDAKATPRSRGDRSQGNDRPQLARIVAVGRPGLAPSCAESSPLDGVQRRRGAGVWRGRFAPRAEVGRPGLEPGTYGLKVRSSTD